MPIANKSPNAATPDPSPTRFDPATLDSSVIAAPLLKKINEEAGLAAKVKARLRQMEGKYNSVVFLPRSQKITVPRNRSALQQLVDAAVGHRTAHSEEQAVRLGKKFAAGNGVFAWLDARTIRRMLTHQDAWRARSARERVNESPEEEPPVTIENVAPSRYRVIIDLNLEYLGGREEAKRWVMAAIPLALKEEGIDDPGQTVHVEKSRDTEQYVFATMDADVILRLVKMDAGEVVGGGNPDLGNPPGDDRTPQEIKAQVLQRYLSTLPPERKAAAPPKFKQRAIYRIWPDFEVRTRITRSISTVKANAAINAFAARGTEITWAVMDSGVQGDHPHFRLHNNLDAASPLHRDFTDDQGPLVDANGHGTHVAGIIAGEWKSPPSAPGAEPERLTAVSRYQDQARDVQTSVQPIELISGMAPECRLVSLKVLDENGIGDTSSIIAAIAHIQEINAHGRRLLIHGVNISAGYDFDPKWFACGQSPLCVEVNQLVKSGVVVVVAAGNTGYGVINEGNNTGDSSAGLGVTINDPGNAEFAITVGSTHRDMPHVYGISYFSSKGPTGDGRIKPDLVAPGERIISCASSLPAAEPGGPRRFSALKKEVATTQECDYIETSGTSMAAPHVSGLAASFLSVRREFIGQPERLKEIFMSTCTDLHRDHYFQGAGLIDLMRAIQSV